MREQINYNIEGRPKKKTEWSQAKKAIKETWWIFVLGMIVIPLTWAWILSEGF